MDFFNSLWDDPEQAQVPSLVDFEADQTADKWIKYSSTYKIISGTFKHPQLWLGIDQHFNTGKKKNQNQPQDSTSTRPKQAYERKEKKPRIENTDQAHDEENKTGEESESDVESSTVSLLSKRYGYVPGLRKSPVLHKWSCLDVREQAECLSLFKKFSTFSGSVIMPSDRAEHFKFEVMYKKVQDEQMEFCQEAFRQWPERAKQSQIVQDLYMRALDVFWMLKANKALELYPHFYKRRLMVPLHSEDIKVEMVKLSDLLQMGAIPGFAKPDQSKRTKPNFSVNKMLQSTDYNFSSDEVVGSLHKLPVSLDPNAESLARLHKAQIVISSGALSTLAETHFNLSKQWTLPISVKEYRTIDKGKTMVKTTVFIDKPLPKQSMTPWECHRFAVKHGLKRILLVRDIKADNKACFTFPIPGVDPLPKENSAAPDEPCEGTSVANPEPDAHPESVGSAPEKNEKKIVEKNYIDVGLKDESSDDRGDEKLVIEESASKATNEGNELKKCSVEESPKCDIPARPTVVGVNCKPQEPFKRKDGLKLPKTPDGFTAPLANTNVTYSSWVIRPENMEQSNNVHQKKAPKKELSVIVRCRVDACERVSGDVTAFSLSPKIEYQFEFAAEEATKEELAREWVSLYFKPAFHVLRVRVDSKNSEIIMYEKKDKAQIAADALKMHGIRLSDSLQTLYSVFSELSTLTKGSYVLHHSSQENAFASLEQCIQGSQENSKSVRNLEEYFGQKFSVASDPNPAWRKLDCSLILPRHEVLQLMPATYRPKRCIGKTFLPSLKPNRKQGDPVFPPKPKKPKKKSKNKKKKYTSTNKGGE